MWANRSLPFHEIPMDCSPPLPSTCSGATQGTPPPPPPLLVEASTLSSAATSSAGRSSCTGVSYSASKVFGGRQQLYQGFDPVSALAATQAIGAGPSCGGEPCGGDDAALEALRSKAGASRTGKVGGGSDSVGA